MADPVTWTLDWNPEFEDEGRLKREILRSLGDAKTMAAVKRFADLAAKEAADDGLETEHIVWLDSALSYAFFVRVWFDLGEQKIFILVEENDLGDIGFLLLEDLACASYGEDESILKVEFKEPEDLGVPP